MQVNERDELNICANSSTDYIVAGIFGLLSSGPIGLGLSLLSLKLLAQASGQKQKWILWVIIGGVATPIINTAQIATGLAIMGAISNINQPQPAQLVEQPLVQPSPIVVEATPDEPIATSTPALKTEFYNYTPTGKAPIYENYSSARQDSARDSAIVSKTGDTFIYGMESYFSPGSFTYSTESYGKQITGEIQITSVVGQKAIGTFTDQMADGSQSCQGRFEINQLSSVSTPLFNAIWRVDAAQIGYRCDSIGKSFELKNMQVR